MKWTGERYNFSSVECSSPWRFTSMSERASKWRVCFHFRFSFCICFLLVNSSRSIQFYLPPHGPRLSAGIKKKLQLGEERYNFFLSDPIILLVFFKLSYYFGSDVASCAREMQGFWVHSIIHSTFKLWNILSFLLFPTVPEIHMQPKCRTNDKKISQLKRCRILIMSQALVFVQETSKLSKVFFFLIFL